MVKEHCDNCKKNTLHNFVKHTRVCSECGNDKNNFIAANNANNAVLTVSQVYAVSQ